MNERFFIVTEQCPMYKQYFDRKEYDRQTAKLFNKFAAEEGIEAKLFVPGETRLGIVPTTLDETRFGDELTKKAEESGLRFFKLKSETNKAWVEAVRANDIHYVVGPQPSWSLGIYGKGSFRLFDHNGTLYFSYECDGNFPEREGLIPIKGSEFWKVMEEIEEKQEGA